MTSKDKLLRIIDKYKEEIRDILEGLENGESYYNDELIIIINLCDYILYSFNYEKYKNIVDNELDMPEELIIKLFEFRNILCHLYKIVFKEHNGMYNLSIDIRNDYYLYKNMSSKFDILLNDLLTEFNKLF